MKTKNWKYIPVGITVYFKYDNEVRSGKILINFLGFNQ